MSAPDPEILGRLDQLLASVSTLVLATANNGGEAHAAPLFFIADGLRLYWLSSPESRHSRALGLAPVAVAVFAPATEWQDIRGAQMTGRAAPVEDASERVRVLDAYRRRFHLGPEFDGAVAASTLYRFDAKGVRYLDNSFGFGFRAEFDSSDIGE